MGYLLSIRVVDDCIVGTHEVVMTPLIWNTSDPQYSCLSASYDVTVTSLWHHCDITVMSLWCHSDHRVRWDSWLRQRQSSPSQGRPSGSLTKAMAASSLQNSSRTTSPLSRVKCSSLRTDPQTHINTGRSGKLYTATKTTSLSLSYLVVLLLLRPSRSLLVSNSLSVRSGTRWMLCINSPINWETNRRRDG